MAIKLFGFTLGQKDVVREQKPEQPSFALPTETMDDGAVTITQNAYYGTYVDLEGAVRNELELITRYREMANHPELEMAIDDIVNEAITHDPTGRTVDIITDNLKQPETVKKKIREEFETVLKMLNFGNLADDLFKRWYIDGRIYYHVVVDEKNPKEGIKELRYIDPRKIRKVREIVKDRDPKTGAQIVKSIAEYYVYSDKGTTTQTYSAQVSAGLRIAPESIINVNSGLMDAKNTFVISYLHKAIKPLNQLRMIEDAVVIYRLSRAPERRIFYIDVGNLPKGKAEQYLRDVMIKFKNKVVYDDIKLNGKVRLPNGYNHIGEGEIIGIVNRITDTYTAYTYNNQLYYDYSEGYTLFITGYSDPTDPNKIVPIANGITADMISLFPIVKEEILIGMINAPEIQSNVFIDRGKLSGNESLLRLGEIDSMNDLINYGYGYFKLTEI